MKPLHPHWREVFARKEPEMEPLLACPMKPVASPDRFCKIPKACYIVGKDGAVGHTACRIRPVEETKCPN